MAPDPALSRTCALATLAIVTALLPASAQQGGRDPGFGLPADEWCAERGGRDRSACDVREETLEGVRVLDLDTGGNGSISVRGGNRDTIRLRTRVLARAGNASEAKAIVDDVAVRIDGGRVRVDGPPRGRGESWTVSFEAEVPRDLELTVATRNGGIAVHDFAGRATARTVNGGLSFGDVSGEIRGETINGGIAVNLSGRRWEGKGLDLQTRNGGVLMSLPADYSAELEAGTINGGIDIDFPIVVQGRLTRLNRRITTTLGSGGAPLRVETTNGGVRIRKR